MYVADSVHSQQLTRLGLALEGYIKTQWDHVNALSKSIATFQEAQTDVSVLLPVHSLLTRRSADSTS